MAGNKRPSFLKRQKEQLRQARAVEKREQRRARKEARAAGLGESEFGELAELTDANVPAEEPASDEE